MKVLAKIFGTSNEREVKRMMPLVHQINAFEPQIQALSDAELRAKTDEFRARIQERLAPLQNAEAQPQPDAQAVVATGEDVVAADEKRLEKLV